MISFRWWKVRFSSAENANTKKWYTGKRNCGIGCSGHELQLQPNSVLRVKKGPIELFFNSHSSKHNTSLYQWNFLKLVCSYLVEFLYQPYCCCLVVKLGSYTEIFIRKLYIFKFNCHEKHLFMLHKSIGLVVENLYQIKNVMLCGSVYVQL